jgi:hypothetical protein
VIGIALCGGVFAAPVATPPDFVPIQERAQGRSLVGSNLLNDSLYSNPAGSVFTQAYAIEASMLLGGTFAASIVDTKTSQLGGSLGVFRTPVGGGVDDHSQGIRLGLMQRVSDAFGIGVTGKMLWGPRQADGQRVSKFDGDVGFLANFERLQFGGMLRNALGGDARLAQQREVGLGARVNYDNTVFFSAATYARTTDWSPYQFGFGAEYLSPYYFSLKGGYYFRPRENLSAWSAGASILSPKLSMHYAIEFPSGPGRSPEHSLAIAVLL